MDVVIAEVDYGWARAEGAEGWSARGRIVWRGLGEGGEGGKWDQHEEQKKQIPRPKKSSETHKTHCARNDSGHDIPSAARILLHRADKRDRLGVALHWAPNWDAVTPVFNAPGWTWRPTESELFMDFWMCNGISDPLTA